MLVKAGKGNVVGFKKSHYLCPPKHNTPLITDISQTCSSVEKIISIKAGVVFDFLPTSKVIKSVKDLAKTKRRGELQSESFSVAEKQSV